MNEYQHVIQCIIIMVCGLFGAVLVADAEDIDYHPSRIRTLILGLALLLLAISIALVRILR
jgi:hypothetical protein